MLKTSVLAGCLVTGFSTPAEAEKRELLGSYRDWDTIQIERDNGEKHCMMISMPKRSSPGNVTHGEVYMTVTHRPRRKVRDEINFVAGYDLRVGSEVRGTIGNTGYTMFSEGWPSSSRRPWTPRSRRNSTPSSPAARKMAAPRRRDARGWESGDRTTGTPTASRGGRAPGHSGRRWRTSAQRSSIESILL